MKKTIVLSSLMILVVIALTAAATYAYFSGTSDQTATITTAKIDIDKVSGLPMSFDKMLPGEEQVREVAIQNTGNREADFYVQLKVSDTLGTPDFCLPTPVLNIGIEDADNGGYAYNGEACNLFPGPYAAPATIAKVADNVAPDAVRNFKIHLSIDPQVTGAYENGSNSVIIRLIAVQHGGPAPAPDTSNQFLSWPENDPNYE